MSTLNKYMPIRLSEMYNMRYGKEFNKSSRENKIGQRALYVPPAGSTF